MTSEQFRTLFEAMMALADHAPVGKIIEAYEALAPMAPTLDERTHCERIAFLYREAHQLSHRPE